MHVVRQFDTDEEDVVDLDSRSVSASPVMPKLYPALKPRSADEFTPVKNCELLGMNAVVARLVFLQSHAASIGLWHGHPSRDISAQQH
jgi:hypothetical protein